MVAEAPAFTENYISYLRDEVAGHSGIFAQTALLIIHNSMLDTLINSTKDVAAPDAVWYPKTFSHQLEKLITNENNRADLSRCFWRINVRPYWMKGRPYLASRPCIALLDDGKLDFSELQLV